MILLDLVRKRESIRKFTDQPVSRETLDRCLESARLAPSACNSQPWKFIVVDHPELRRKIAETTYSTLVGFNKFVQEAPVLIVIVAEKSNLMAQFGGIVKDKQYNLLDIGIAAEHFCLQAAEENLGTCMLGWFDEKAVRKLLEIPHSRRIPLIIAAGYPPLQPITGEEQEIAG